LIDCKKQLTLRVHDRESSIWQVMPMELHKQITSFERSLSAAWKARFEARPPFVRIAFLVFLGAIVVVGLHGGRKTLWYILLVIVLAAVALLAYIVAPGTKRTS
jgi:hypothetical protein